MDTKINDISKIKDLIRSKNSFLIHLHSDLLVLNISPETKKSNKLVSILKIDVNLDFEIYTEYFTKLITSEELSNECIVKPERIISYYKALSENKFSENPESLDPDMFETCYNFDIPEKFRSAWQKYNRDYLSFNHKKYKILYNFLCELLPEHLV